MSAWSQGDIDTLRAAIASGILSVEYAGPPKRRIEYQSLGAMRALLAEMVASVAQQAGSKPYRLAATRKGFGRC